jgi:general secretion pathway protein F
LIQSRVPFVEALTLAAAVTAKLFIRRRVEYATERVREGTSLRDAISAAGAFRRYSRRSQAERRAAISARCWQQRDLDAWVRTLVSLVEPAILLLMGGLLMILVLAILLPIVSMNNLVGV